MIKENNNWFCTDPDCMQYCQKVSETEFRLIQAVWLDTCGDNTESEYAVCTGYIDIELYSKLLLLSPPRIFP